MEPVSPCPPHDWRRVYPRHITGQDQTDAKEGILFVLCCRCGKSPLSFARKDEWREYRRAMANAFPDWPDDLKITYYEWDEDPNGEGPSVEFVKRGTHEPDDG